MGYDHTAQSRDTESYPELSQNLPQMRTLHNTKYNPTCWNKVPSMQGGTAAPSIPEVRFFLLSLADKSQHSIPKKDRHPPKRNTIHHPVSLNGKYSKAAWLGGLIWRIVGGLLYIRINVGCRRLYLYQHFNQLSRLGKKLRMTGLQFYYFFAFNSCW